MGRPLSDITHKLNNHLFTADAERVLDTLTRSEREVSNAGHHYLARMLPYRTPDDYIDGVVLTFIDITELKKAEAALRASEGAVSPDCGEYSRLCHLYAGRGRPSDKLERGSRAREGL